MYTSRRVTFLSLALAGLCAGLSGCGGSGNTDHVDGSDVGSGGQFVGGDDTTGTISLSLTESTLAIGGVTDFSVQAKSSNGEAVQGIRISCDSEQGVAILEPTTGAETTDSFGSISGKIGCAMPGSYQFGCRLPVGAARRQFVTVHCDGAIPSGFAGFPGAAGGGLGGGGQTIGEPGDVTDNVRLTSVSVHDNGDTSGAGTSTIDIASHICSGADTSTTADDKYEGLFDTFVVFNVTNDSTETVTFDHFSLTVPEATGDGSSDYDSGSYALTTSGVQVAPNGGTASFTAIAFEVGTVNGKSYVGSKYAIPSALGVRSVTLRLIGHTTSGDQITLTRAVSLAFADYDTCSSAS